MRSKWTVVATLLLIIASDLIVSLAQNIEPIRLSGDNPHYFSYQGKTITLISSGEHYGAVMNLDVDYSRYLDTIEAAGFNYTRLFGGSYVEVPGKSFGILRNDLAPLPGRFLAPWMRSNEPGYAGGGNKFDLEQFDPAYFKRLHAFLADAERRGIVVEISLFSAEYGEPQWDINPFNEKNNVNGTVLADWKKVNTPDNGKILGYQQQYVRKLVEETNAFSNVIYEIQNEPWSDRPVLTNVVNPFLFPPARNIYPNSIDLPDTEALAFETRVAEWVMSEEAKLPKKHLLAQNYSNFFAPVKALIPGVSVVNFHYAYPDAAALNYGLGKALSYDETGFLGREDDGYVRQAWDFMLSGGGVFNGLDYSFSPGHEDGRDTEANGPGGGSVELRHRLGILNTFIKSLPLAAMKPDKSALVHGSGVFARVLSDGHGTYALYLDGDGPTDLTMELDAGSYVAHWVNTKVGTIRDMPRFQHLEGEVVIHSPDFKNGIGLRLERVRN